ncbi:type II toxin-antitoxin system HicB family antitoxin [bacterium]|nr:type II toxin-antitoxin system HicB family antitoxin [bacterium]MBU1937401.1 type II toxin-antitoxin system HicB family antitoxin [bacterium]
MPTYRFQIVIEQDEDGLYVAECPALQGCYTQGTTFEEAIKNIREVIRMCLQELKEEHKPIESRYPEIIGIKTVEIAL